MGRFDELERLANLNKLTSQAEIKIWFQVTGLVEHVSQDKRFMGISGQQGDTADGFFPMVELFGDCTGSRAHGALIPFADHDAHRLPVEGKPAKSNDDDQRCERQNDERE